VNRYLFPKWSNKVMPFIAGGLVLLVSSVAGAFWYYGTNKHLEVGYQPVQPVEFSHKLHAGDLGMDCRYCHSTVERAAFAAVPPTQVCMNCHSKIKTDSPRLLPVQESAANNQPIRWVRVHNLPDYVYFDHSAHLAAGVGCSSCHGRVDQMPRVTQKQPLTMGWCLECHRNPGPSLRPSTEITNMSWQSPPLAENAQAVTATGRLANPPKHCSGCHR
jgi:hypothetical protein